MGFSGFEDYGCGIVVVAALWALVFLTSPCRRQLLRVGL